MDLSYTEEQESIRKMVRELCRKELAPGAEERDRTGEFNCELYLKLGRLGIPRIRFPNGLSPENWVVERRTRSGLSNHPL